MRIIIPFADELVILDENGGYSFATLENPPRMEGVVRILLPAQSPVCKELKEVYPHAECVWDAHALRERAAYASLVNLHEKARADGEKRIRETYREEVFLTHAWAYAERLRVQLEEREALLLTMLADVHPLLVAEWGKHALARIPEGEEYAIIHREAEGLRGEEKRVEALRGEILSRVERLAPTTSRIATPKLLLRLLSRAGTLESLAKMHAGKIQLLGSEKALFTALRKQRKTPKYGFLYHHPLVQRVRKEEKARAARILAEMISIAARHDMHTQRLSEEILRLARVKLEKKGFPTDWLEQKREAHQEKE